MGNGSRRQQGKTRRHLLRATGGALGVGLAGCIGGSGNAGRNQNGSNGTSESSGSNVSQNGSANNQGGANNKVTFLNDRSARDVWDAAAQEFNSNSDYTVEITWLPKGTSMNEQVAKMQSAGNLPALIFETSADCYTETLEGLTAPLTGVVDELGVEDPVRVDGESYLVPVVASPLMMMYRSDVVQGNPRTRSEWLAEAERIQNEEDQSPYVVPSGRTNAATTHMNQTLWNGGVNPYSGTGNNIEIVLDNDDNRKKAIATMEWLQNINEFGPQASGWDWSDCSNALIQEQLVGWAGLGLGIQELQANRPDLVSKFKPAPYPTVQGQDPTQWWAYFEGIYSYKGANNVEGGREFLKFFLESDYYFDYLRQTAPFSFPTSLEAIQDKRYANAEIYDTLPAFLELVENNWDSMASVLNTGDDGAPNAVAAQAYSQQLFGQAADQLLYGGKSPAGTVDWLTKQLRSIAQQ